MIVDEEALGGTYPIGPRRVHRVGYGAMQLAGDGFFGPPSGDRDVAIDVLQAAVNAGVDHIDTAQFYGPGTVNKLIREALHPYPVGLAIVSKVARRRAPNGAIVRADKPDELRDDIEDNLNTLGTDRLAAVNLRLIDPTERPGAWFDAQISALARAREERLIDGVGLSNITSEHLRRAADQTNIVCVQNLFNLADQRSADVLAECRARDIAFVPYCPLGLPGAPRTRLLADPVLVAAATRRGATPVQIALAWLLDLAPDILLIAGTRSPSHLAENLAVADIQLDDTTRAQLADRFGEPAG